MKKWIKFIFLLTLYSIILGPLAKVPSDLPYINIYLTDILVGILTLTVIFLSLKEELLIYFVFFIATALISNLLSPIPLSVSERFISFLYLLRFAAYTVVFIAFSYLNKNKILTIGAVKRVLITIGVILAVIGWLQYVLYPDLRNLFYLGWDPHYKRIFGSLLDPNYLGLIFVFTLIILQIGKYQSKYALFLKLFILVTLAFTYSRSSYLALFAAAIYYAINNKLLKKYILFIVLFISILFFLPRPQGESVRLERLFSAVERINNWSDAVTVIKKNPVLGVGFNTLRFAKKQYGFLKEDWLSSHSAAGVDNSFLFIAGTTGILGLGIYILLLYKMFKLSQQTGRSTLIAAIIHSLFLNSLFLPWIMLWIWTIIAIDKSKEQK